MAKEKRKNKLPSITKGEFKKRIYAKGKTITSFMEMLKNNKRSISKYSENDELPRVYMLELFYFENKDTIEKLNEEKKTK